MLTVDGRTIELTRKAITEEIGKTMEILEYGQPHVVSDFATYQRHVGYLSGLRFLEQSMNVARAAAEQETR